MRRTVRIGAGAAAMAVAAVMLAPLNALAQNLFYETKPEVSIPDADCPSATTGSIYVPDNVIVTDVNVGILISHTYRDDLVIRLQPPASAAINLFYDDVVPPDGANNLYGTFNQQSSGVPNDGFNDTVKSYANREFHPYSTIGGDDLSVINGTSAQGWWELGVCDRLAQDTGTFHSFALYITYAVSTTTTTPPTTTTTAPGTTTTTEPGTTTTQPGTTTSTTKPTTTSLPPHDDDDFDDDSDDVFDDDISDDDAGDDAKPDDDGGGDYWDPGPDGEGDTPPNESEDDAGVDATDGCGV
ncbi:proprotein convertase P-domain-containing protein [bacterium]|nr:proprotein convertase P-domain-containing protein [bacterium]